MWVLQVSLILCTATAAVSGQRVDWRSSKLGMPKNAVVAGYDTDKLPIFVGRAKHGSFYIVGKVLPHQNRAYVAYEGKEFLKDEWEYLVGSEFDWIRSYDGLLPRNAVKNEQTENNVPEYIGRQFYEESLTPGKIITAKQRLFMPFFGKEYAFDKYEVLVTPKCLCGLSEWSLASMKLHNQTVIEKIVL